MTKEIMLHGTFVSVYGVGVLLTGKPGVGKSELALTLINKHHQLIADDAVFFKQTENKVIGKSQLDKPFLSIRGIGLLDLQAIFGPTCFQLNHNLDLIIDLQTEPSLQGLAHLVGERQTKEILGCLIPCVTIPIITPRNLEILIETIVRSYLLGLDKISETMNTFNELLFKKMEYSPS